MITIELPFPSSELSPNARIHWAVKSRATKDARAEGWYAAIFDVGWGDKSKLKASDLRCTWTFYPPDLRRRDDDNLVRQCKAYRDGVCDALGIDDSQIKETVSRMADVDRPDGRVVMTLEAM